MNFQQILSYRRRSNYASFLILRQNATFQTGNFQWCVTLRKLIFYCCVTQISWLQMWTVIVACHRWCVKLRHFRDMVETSMEWEMATATTTAVPRSLWTSGVIEDTTFVKKYGRLVGEKATTVRVPGKEHDRSASNAVMQSKYATE